MAGGNLQAFSWQQKKSKKLMHHLTEIAKCWQLYLIFLPPLAFVIIFHYVPMYGAQIAFKNYSVIRGFAESPWAGLVHFRRFFNSNDFRMLMQNTIGLSVYNLLASFPFPILLALMLNYARNVRFKKTVQMVTYAPFFISTVVMVSIILEVLSPRTGIVNTLIKGMGLDPVNFMGTAGYFKSIYVWSGIWQATGYGAVIYLAALAGIDTTLHEAAVVDGANKFQRVRHIDLPGIMPTALILLILNTGQILNTGFEKILLMQNPLNMRTSQVIDTFVYQVGIAAQTVNFSYPTAVGLFKSVVNLTLLVIVNSLARKYSNSSLW